VSRLHDLGADHARGGNGTRVAENHLESFLVDRVLRLGGSDLLLSSVSAERVLEFGVRDEAGPDFVHVLSISSLVV